jgi:hypothetical protein
MQIHEYRMERKSFSAWLEAEMMGVFSCSCGYMYMRFKPGKPSPKNYSILVKQFGPVWEAAYQQLLQDSTIGEQEKTARMSKLLKKSYGEE